MTTIWVVEINDRIAKLTGATKRGILAYKEACNKIDETIAVMDDKYMDAFAVMDEYMDAFHVTLPGKFRDRTPVHELMVAVSKGAGLPIPTDSSDPLHQYLAGKVTERFNQYYGAKAKPKQI